MICLIPVIVRSKLKAYIVNQCWLIAARKIVAHSLAIFWQSAYCNFKTRVHRTRSSKFREKSRGCIFYIFVVRQLNQLYIHSQHSCIFISSDKLWCDFINIELRLLEYDFSYLSCFRVIIFEAYFTKATSTPIKKCFVRVFLLRENNLIYVYAFRYTTQDISPFIDFVFNFHSL